MEYLAGGEPMLTVMLSAQVSVVIDAVVDSGASRSFFPLWVARRLALTPCLSRERAWSVGRVFDIWRPRRPVQGHVIDSAAQEWGPRLELDPAFAESETALLGRADFFRHFRITFEESADAPRFHLDYDAA